MATVDVKGLNGQIGGREKELISNISVRRSLPVCTEAFWAVVRSTVMIDRWCGRSHNAQLLLSMSDGRTNTRTDPINAAMS